MNPSIALYKLAAYGVYAGYGLPVAARRRWLERTESWTREQRDAWKLQRLDEIVRFAWEHVAFYRGYWGDHGVSYRPLRNLDDIGVYPVLTKDVFRAHAAEIVPDNLGTIRHVCKHTGGSTGAPVHYRLDVDQWVTMQAFHLWGWSQTGYELGEPVGVIAGGSLTNEATTFTTRVRNFVERRRFLFGVQMDRALARKYHKELLTFSPTILYGYPSILYLFAQYLSDEQLQLPTVKAVITTAEMLEPRHREAIQTHFGCHVFNNYGCNDGGVESYECRFHHGLHYNDLQSLIQVRDEGTADAALIITNLWNRSTPFIRYENGDAAELSNTFCECGSVFPVITSIQGRTADIIHFSNGQSLSGPALTLIFARFAIDGWQVVQTGPTRIEVRLCTPDGIQMKDVQHIHTILRNHLSPGIDIEVRHVERLALSAAGKRKPIWVQTAQ